MGMVPSKKYTDSFPPGEFEGEREGDKCGNAFRSRETWELRSEVLSKPAWREEERTEVRNGRRKRKYQGTKKAKRIRQRKRNRTNIAITTKTYPKLGYHYEPYLYTGLGRNWCLVVRYGSVHVFSFNHFCVFVLSVEALGTQQMKTGKTERMKFMSLPKEVEQSHFSCHVTVISRYHSIVQAKLPLHLVQVGEQSQWDFGNSHL